MKSRICTWCGERVPENQQGRHWGKRCLSPQTTSRPEEKPAATRNDRSGATSELTAKSKAPFVGYRDARYFPNVDPYRAPTKVYAPRPYRAPRAAYAPRPHQAPMWVGAPRPVPLMDLRPWPSIRIPQPRPPAKTPSPNVGVSLTPFSCLYRGCGKKFARQCVRDAHHSCHKVGETVGLGRPVSGICQDCGEELDSQRALKDHWRLCLESPRYGTSGRSGCGNSGRRVGRGKPHRETRGWTLLTLTTFLSSIN